MQQSDKKSGLVKALIKVREEIVDSSQIEIIGNRHVIIQGSKGIIEYNDDLIRVSLDEKEVQFYGEKLCIHCLSQDSLEIKGSINRVEYI